MVTRFSERPVLDRIASDACPSFIIHLAVISPTVVIIAQCGVFLMKTNSAYTFLGCSHPPMPFMAKLPFLTCNDLLPHTIASQTEASRRVFLGSRPSATTGFPSPSLPSVDSFTHYSPSMPAVIAIPLLCLEANILPYASKSPLTQRPAQCQQRHYDLSAWWLDLSLL